MNVEKGLIISSTPESHNVNNAMSNWVPSCEMEEALEKASPDQLLMVGLNTGILCAVDLHSFLVMSHDLVAFVKYA